MIMKAYKGFRKNNDGRIYCLPIDTAPFYYEEGKTYECKVAVLCACGFHACTLPIDVFNYYNSHKGNVEYHEVELENISDERRNDSKVAGTKITIGRKITPNELVDISIQLIMDDKEKYFKNKPFYLIRKDTKWNYLKPDGTLLSEQWFEYADDFENGLARVYSNDKGYNFIREDGTLLSEQWFDYVWNFINGFAQVKLNNKMNIIKEDGTYLTEQWFDFVWNFINGLARVYFIDKGYNFLKPDGALLSDKWFDFVVDFYNDFAQVQLNDKYNFIKPDGILFSEQWFDDVDDFYDGFVRVKLNEKWYKLNEINQFLIV